ncbi:MAG: CotH kinase family protein [Bacilli bacterium]|nr:CotH kinase family protein [Bacilli bacterium]MBN2876326.1 CotH kinase family protein [Bacilli bacterium]
MKKLFLMFLMTITFIPFLVACTPAETTVATTLDPRIDVIDSEYDLLSEDFPTEITMDTNLPEPTSSDFVIVYQIDDVTLDDYIISYQANAYDSQLVLVVSITYQGLAKEYIYTFTMIRDEELYNQAQQDLAFDTAFETITDAIPYEIYSDFTLPQLETVGMQISYTSEDILIYRDRLIFDFPDTQEIVSVSASITYNRETRVFVIPIRLAPFNQLARIPEIHINTDGSSPIESDQDYVGGDLYLVTFNSVGNAQVDIDKAPMNIRLRGNSTLFMPKKSYKIKFDNKTSMFTDYKEKDWVLLANFADQTLIRTYLAFQYATALEMEFSPIAVFVDLYINGSYQGNYMLTDQVEVTNDRVDVEEHSSNLDTGYLLEWDSKIYDTWIDHSDENYFFIYGIPFVIKTPDWDDPEYSIDQLYFIEDYMLMVYQTLQNKQDYSHLIDEASFIDWFLVNEVFKNVDSGYSSIYYYKDVGGLLKMGPVWDFDLSTGNPGHLQEDLRGPEGWYTARQDKNILFYYLMEYPEFREHLKQRWNEVYQEITLNLLGDVFPICDMMARSIYLNFQKWDVIGSNEDWYTTPEILALDTYYEQVWFLYDYLSERIEWLNYEINLF